VDKKVNSIAFVYRDVSAQRQNEILLQKHYRSSKNFRNALNRSAIISITDLEGTILDVNRAFCQLSKFSKHEVIGKKHSIVSAEIHDAAFFEEMWAKLKSGKSWRGEICNRAKDDTLYWLEMIINPIQDESGKVYQYLAVSYPISQRKKAEKEKQELLERLAHYAFMNSHNLRRPLANILGLVSLFNSENAEFDQKIIEKIRVSAFELDKIVHEMNDLLKSNELKNMDSFSAPKRSSSS
jgi:PAS domain S-box-containing protein